MNNFCNAPEHEYYVVRARELRAECWRNFFTGIYQGSAFIVGRVADTARGFFDDRRFAS